MGIAWQGIPSSNDLTQAEEAIDKALSLKERLGDAWYTKSKIPEASGRTEEAQEAMKKAEEYGYES